MVSLFMIKKIVDGIEPEVLEGFVNASRHETIGRIIALTQ